MDTDARVVWTTAMAVLLASGLMWLAQKGCVPEPDTTPRPAYERLRVDFSETPAPAERRTATGDYMYRGMDTAETAHMAGTATKGLADPLRARDVPAMEPDGRELRA